MGRWRYVTTVVGHWLFLPPVTLGDGLAKVGRLGGSVYGEDGGKMALPDNAGDRPVTDPRRLMTVTDDDSFVAAALSPSDLADDILGWRNSGLTVRVVRGPKMVTFDGLMTEFGAALQFPHYFGENWAAFQECLEDMDWLPAGRGLVIAVTDADEVLSGERQADLAVLVRSFARARATYASSIADGEWWDRPAIPFHVVLQSDPTSSAGLSRWLDAGATLQTPDEATPCEEGSR